MITKSVRNMAAKLYNTVTYTDIPDNGVSMWLNADSYGMPSSLKLSAVYGCIDIISSDLAKIPYYSFDTSQKAKNTIPDVRRLLSTRPNEYMTPFVYNKLMEVNRLIAGNAYAYKQINRRTGRIEQLIPLNPDDVAIHFENRKLWFTYSGDVISKGVYLPSELIHLLGLTRNGIEGESVLTYARRTIGTAQAQEDYSEAFFKRGGRPQAILSTPADLQPKTARDGTQVNPKDAIRNEWERLNSGPQNANRVAILDNGLQYKEVAQMSARDAMFVETKDLTIADIARFFRVPPYKLWTGKQTYSTNEQNDIDYANGTIVPYLTGNEQEYTIKLLSDAEREGMISVKGNINVLLRGDMTARMSFYEKGRNIGLYSVNDICDLEDMPGVEGGDERYASLNYVPLADFKKLSQQRNGMNDNSDE